MTFNRFQEISLGDNNRVTMLKFCLQIANDTRPENAIFEKLKLDQVARRTPNRTICASEGPVALHIIDQDKQVKVRIIQIFIESSTLNSAVTAYLDLFLSNGGAIRISSTVVEVDTKNDWISFVIDNLPNHEINCNLHVVVDLGINDEILFSQGLIRGETELSVETAGSQRICAVRTWVDCSAESRLRHFENGQRGSAEVGHGTDSFDMSQVRSTSPHGGNVRVGNSEKPLVLLRGGAVHTLIFPKIMPDDGVNYFCDFTFYSLKDPVSIEVFYRDCTYKEFPDEADLDGIHLTSVWSGVANATLDLNIIRANFDLPMKANYIDIVINFFCSRGGESVGMVEWSIFSSVGKSPVAMLGDAASEMQMMSLSRGHVADSVLIESSDTTSSGLSPRFSNAVITHFYKSAVSDYMHIEFRVDKIEQGRYIWAPVVFKLAISSSDQWLEFRSGRDFPAIFKEFPDELSDEHGQYFRLKAGAPQAERIFREGCSIDRAFLYNVLILLPEMTQEGILRLDLEDLDKSVWTSAARFVQEDCSVFIQTNQPGYL